MSVSNIPYPTVTLPFVAVPASSLRIVDEPVRVIGLTVSQKQ